MNTDNLVSSLKALGIIPCNGPRCKYCGAPAEDSDVCEDHAPFPRELKSKSGKRREDERDANALGMIF